MTVPMVDLGRDSGARDLAVREAVLRVLDHRGFILGPEVEAFEKAVAPWVDGAHVIGVSSGTDALLMGLMALGVGPGDDVVTSPFSFFATAGTVARLGARPRFLDIEPAGFGLDWNSGDVAALTTAKALVPVHLFGHVPDLAEAEGCSVPILEDAAQGLGARDARGRPAGTVGRLSAFSFFPTKNLGACGDAGMVVTRDEGLADVARRLRTHGQSTRYVHTVIGGNFRLDAIQAAALTASLPFLEEATAARQRNARAYLERFASAGILDGRLVPPLHHPRHTYHQFVVRIPGRRDAVQAGLRERGIGSAIYYPVPFHLQPCFGYLGYARGDFPEAERAAAEVLALPIFPGLREAEVDEVVGALTDLL